MVPNPMPLPRSHTTSAQPRSVHVKNVKNNMSKFPGCNTTIISLFLWHKPNLVTKNLAGVNCIRMTGEGHGVLQSLHPSPSLCPRGSCKAGRRHRSSKNQKTRRSTKAFSSHLLPENKIWMDFLMFQSTSFCRQLRNSQDQPWELYCL